MNESRADTLLSVLDSVLKGDILASSNNLGHAEIVVEKEKLVDVVSKLKNEATLSLNMLLSVTAVDYLDQEFLPRPKAERFELVYHFLSLQEKFRVRVKVPVSEDDTHVQSLTALYPGADFMESEVWDMYGISFDGHPGLRRILMYEEFEGYPLRKDYPLQGKQPRIPLRSPEVENTARLMNRPNLVQINKRKAGGMA